MAAQPPPPAQINNMNQFMTTVMGQQVMIPANDMMHWIREEMRAGRLDASQSTPNAIRVLRHFNVNELPHIDPEHGFTAASLRLAKARNKSSATAISREQQQDEARARALEAEAAAADAKENEILLRIEAAVEIERDYQQQQQAQALLQAQQQQAAGQPIIAIPSDNSDATFDMVRRWFDMHATYERFRTFFKDYYLEEGNNQ